MKLCLDQGSYSLPHDHHREYTCRISYIPCTTTFRCVFLAKSTGGQRIVEVGICRMDHSLTKVLDVDRCSSLSLSTHCPDIAELVQNRFSESIEDPLGNLCQNRNLLGIFSEERPRVEIDCYQLFQGKVSSHCLLLVQR